MLAAAARRPLPMMRPRRTFCGHSQGMQDVRLSFGFVESARAAIGELLREYEQAIGVSLCFQNFAAELAHLPGAYAPPRGQLIVASSAAGLVGCVALRPVAGDADLCELKRLYVRPAARGTGLGRRLTLAALDEARRLGYRRICLDTLVGMTQAQGLYRALGFHQTGESGHPPAQRVLLFARDL
jgi:ribosomal protein S18 acetylase RimI-like enzyme